MKLHALGKLAITLLSFAVHQTKAECVFYDHKTYFQHKMTYKCSKNNLQYEIDGKCQIEQNSDQGLLVRSNSFQVLSLLFTEPEQSFTRPFKPI